MDMPLSVKDPQVDALATHLMLLLGTNKTDAVRRALQSEIAHQTGKRDLFEQTADFVQALRERAGPELKPADAAFIDSLYERR
ncbi:type II toxin-antitoxin system VapB family antitoxin [Methylobacterium sp. J-030]|uniref:type II toxin-antitoxin system VapB family antitoxin n=1 Tax=Methylobacterium sp. J-030 TaxID=2836627 RepID=UPI001FB889B4|nr:type II toxin-antitoxin system VapB family antitoxin [Methylobacterium sp. J-030]MCJ2069879.1 type II toxin-antitoxin system VapB family antitoxin [Methylobacterium sp. J-030]